MQLARYTCVSIPSGDPSRYRYTKAAHMYANSLSFASRHASNCRILKLRQRCQDSLGSYGTDDGCVNPVPKVSAASDAPYTSTNPRDQSAAPIMEVAVTLRKPTGIVFAHGAAGGPVYVAEIAQGSEADRSGLVKVGDTLARCSAVVLKSHTGGIYEQEGSWDNVERVEFDCTGQEFKTVMGALKSNSARLGITDVTLVLHRPQVKHSESF